MRKIGVGLGFALALAGSALFRRLGPWASRDVVAAVERCELHGDLEAAAERLLPLLEEAPLDPPIRVEVVSLAMALARRPAPTGLALAAALVEPYRRCGRREAGRPVAGAGTALIGPALRSVGRSLTLRASLRGSRALAERAHGFGFEPEAAPRRIPRAPIDGRLAEAGYGPGGNEGVAERPPLTAAPARKVAVEAAGHGSLARPLPRGWPQPTPRPPVRVIAVNPPREEPGWRNSESLPIARAPEPRPEAESHHLREAEAPTESGESRAPAAAPGSLLAAACAAAASGRFLEAASLLGGLSDELQFEPGADALASVVYFNASYLSVRAKHCEEGRAFARLAAEHDDPWWVPSNLGWLRTLEQVRNCNDFNLSTIVTVVRLKPIPASVCGLASGRADSR